MEPFLVGCISVLAIVVVVVLGVPIAVALAVVSMAGLWLILGDPMTPIQMLGSASFHGVFNYSFSVVPMFVLMGFLANQSGAAEEAYGLAAGLLRRRPGGLAMATVAANALFAAITGISVASAAMFSRVSLGPMMHHGYDRTFSLGTIAGSSILGMLIPPSVLFILYGIVARESIGALFAAGLVPGIILALVYCLGIYVLVRSRPGLVRETLDDENNESRFGLSALGKTLPIVMLIVIVLGGIYSGFFTPTEAGGVGALGALILAIARRRLPGRAFWNILLETGYVSVSILLILVTANMYSRMLTISQFPERLTQAFTGLSLPPVIVVIVFMAVLILLGAILDSTSIILICMPIMLPTIKAMGYHPVWFGVISIMAIETGLITPPFGLVVYTMKATLGHEAEVEQIFRGAAPFLVMMLFVIGMIVAWPGLCLWLPGIR
jgi:tripartite ATP-independent transporter DctM subunit